jgi:hypothetical protein
MILKKAIEDAKEIKASIHLYTDMTRSINVSKTDAMQACTEFLNYGSNENNVWTDDRGNIIAMILRWNEGKGITLFIGK